jgi:hypothetical protein
MASKAEIKKQVEYYLSDSNLSRDQFFNGKIKEAEGGWLKIEFILNCNKVKQFKLKNGAADIVEAVKDSELVETDESGTSVRRKGDKAIPELQAGAASGSKKRDAKAADKEEQKGEAKEDDGLPQLDERGNPILANLDFENPVIIHFKTDSKSAPAEFKVNWKDVESAVRKAYPRLKLVYSRADQFEGDLAISSHRLNNAELEKLSGATITIQG